MHRRILSALPQVGGSLLFWPETDLNCGTGKYRLNTLFLALSAAVPNTLSNATVLVSLFAFFPSLEMNFSATSAAPFAFDAGTELSGTLTAIASYRQFIFPRSDPGWSYFSLSSDFIVDVNVSAFSLLTWRTIDFSLRWNEDYTQVCYDFSFLFWLLSISLHNMLLFAAHSHRRIRPITLSSYIQ